MNQKDRNVKSYQNGSDKLNLFRIFLGKSVSRMCPVNHRRIGQKGGK